MQVSLRLDGRAVALKQAYTSVSTTFAKHVKRNTFVGYYADVSDLVPDHEYRVELNLPKLRPGQFQGLFFDNVETEYTDVTE